MGGLEGPPRISARWRLLAYLTTAYAAGAFGVLGVSPLSPALLEAFALSRFQVGLLLPAVYVGGLVVVFASLLACLVVTGVGWSIVNPAIGRAIIELFPANERGLAMGIKQMGLTVGGIASALALPPLAAQQGWRVALALCAVVARARRHPPGAPVVAVGAGDACVSVAERCLDDVTGGIEREPARSRATSPPA